MAQKNTRQTENCCQCKTLNVFLNLKNIFISINNKICIIYPRPFIVFFAKVKQ